MSDVVKGIGIFIALVVILVICGRIYQYWYGNINSGSGGNGNIISVSPIPITPGILAQLPIGQTASTMLPIPKPEKPELGMISTQAVVITDQGNTLIVNTQKLEWGLRLDPKVYIGMSDAPFAGVGLNVVTVWRINTDIFIATPIDENIIQKGYVGGGLSYQVLDNTFLGATIMGSTEGKVTAGAYLSLRF